MTQKALVLSDIHQTYVQGTRRLEVLSGIQLAVAHGEAVGLVGPSGAGKSTLLHIAGLLERPGQGEVEIDGMACSGRGEAERTQIRRDHIGFVYQFHHLLPEFTALENVILPQRITGTRTGRAAERAEELLTDLGLGERLEHRPAQLSGGEQQRVAIARALANRPSLLLADEPTGNLDEETAERVMNQLLDLVDRHNLAALVATHNMAMAKRADRTLRLHTGRISAE